MSAESSNPVADSSLGLPRRRWWQFSLRTLLVVVTLACVGAGVVGTLWRYYQEGQREKELIAWVEDVGGHVEYDEEASRRDWRRCLGRWYPPVVVGVDFSEAERWPVVQSGPLRERSRESWVQWVGPLVEFERLQSLNLRQTGVRDLTSLAQLAELRVLDVGRTEVSEIGPLAALDNLEQLSLKGTPVTDLAALAELSSLRELDLSFCRRLTSLAPLAGQAKLERLNLYGTSVSDVSPLAGLENLEEVEFGFCFELEDISPLAELPKARRLAFVPTRLERGQLERLEEALPGCEISYSW